MPRSRWMPPPRDLREADHTRHDVPHVREMACLIERRPGARKRWWGREPAHVWGCIYVMRGDR